MATRCGASKPAAQQRRSTQPSERPSDTTIARTTVSPAVHLHRVRRRQRELSQIAILAHFLTELYGEIARTLVVA
jgi:hypothetical protein